MGYFLFHQFFAFLWGVQGVSVLEMHSYEQISLLGELALYSKMKRKGKKNNYFGIFLNYTMVRSLLAPLSDCSYIHLRVA